MRPYRAGALSFAEFDASVGGWINHVRFAGSWGLRQHVLHPFVFKPGDTPRKKARAPLRSAGVDSKPAVQRSAAQRPAIRRGRTQHPEAE
jgi:hypothetical protein